MLVIKDSDGSTPPPPTHTHTLTEQSENVCRSVFTHCLIHSLNSNPVPGVGRGWILQTGGTAAAHSENGNSTGPSGRKPTLLTAEAEAIKNSEIQRILEFRGTVKVP